MKPTLACALVLVLAAAAVAVAWDLLLHAESVPQGIGDPDNLVMGDAA